MSSPFRVRISGPLSGFAAGFREELLASGYSPGTAAKHLQLMARLSGWMAVHDVGAAALGRGEIERFVGERRVTHAQLASARALTPLLAHLRGLGVVPAAVAGVTDGGGNKASGNGNPAQCTNIACT